MHVVLYIEPIPVASCYGLVHAYMVRPIHACIRSQSMEAKAQCHDCMHVYAIILNTLSLYIFTDCVSYIPVQLGHTCMHFDCTSVVTMHSMPIAIADH